MSLRRFLLMPVLCLVCAAGETPTLGTLNREGLRDRLAYPNLGVRLVVPRGLTIRAYDKLAREVELRSRGGCRVKLDRLPTGDDGRSFVAAQAFEAARMGEPLPREMRVGGWPALEWRHEDVVATWIGVFSEAGTGYVNRVSVSWSDARRKVSCQRSYDEFLRELRLTWS